MTEQLTVPLFVILVIITMLFGIGAYLILFKGSLGELISWVSPLAQGIPDKFG